jgi:hypothetical protein
MKSIVEHQEVPKEEVAVETFGALKEWYEDWHLAVGHPPHSRRNGPRAIVGAGKVGHRPQIDDPPCHSCIVEETVVRDQAKTVLYKKSARTDVWEEKSVKTRMQQWHKESISKGTATSRK